MLRHYFKVALRNICQDRMQNTISVIGIAFGIFCFCITAYYVSRTNSQYTDFPNYHNLAELRITETTSSYADRRISKEIVEQLRAHPVAGVEKLALGASIWNDANITFSKNENETIPFLCRIAQVNDDFFEVYSCQAAAGALKLRPGEVIVSESCARKVYGTESVVGKGLCFTPPGGKTDALNFSRIVGVVRDFDSRADGQRSDIYMPSELNSSEVIVLLSDQVSDLEINERLAQMNLFPDQSQKRATVVRLSAIPVPADVWLVQSLVLFVASLVLLAGLINFLKACVYTFYNRVQELSLRKELGASRLSLFTMLYMEIAVVLLGAGFLSFCITEMVAPRLISFFPPEYHSMVMVDLSVLVRQQLLFLAALFLICAAIAWFATMRMDRISVMTGLRGNGTGRHGIRNFMMGFQIFICIVFIGGAGGLHLIYQNMEKDRYFPIAGEEMKEIWSFSLRGPHLQGYEEAILSQVGQLSGVKEILRSSFSKSVTYETPQGNRLHGTILHAGENYFSFYRIPVQGRLPDKGQSIVVQQSFQEELDSDSAVGTVALGEERYTVTGTFKREPFTNERKGRFVAVAFSENGPFVRVKCTSGRASEVKTQVEKIVRRYLPQTIPFEIKSGEAELFDKNSGLDLIRNLFAVLSVIAVVITVLGIYSTITIDTQSRQKEVAIRKVNGADMKEIALLFGKLYLRLLLVSTLIAFPALFSLILALPDSADASHFYQPLFWLVLFGAVASMVFATVAYRIRAISKMNPAVIIKKD